MKKFEGMLFCTDLDGTLFRTDKTVSAPNREAIAYFKAEGGIFTFITGRVPKTASGICQIIDPNGPYGCFNGGGIYDPRQNAYLWTEKLSADALELVKAVEEARKYNAEILIEEYLVGVAATVGVLEKNGKAFATEILELRPKNEWYDYEAKYTKGMTEFILPAELTADMTEKVKQNAVKAFEVCGCSGVSRVDFLIVNDIPYILEINTNPGMTDTSDLPAQAEACGIDYDSLVDMVLHSAGLNK